MKQVRGPHAGLSCTAILNDSTKILKPGKEVRFLNQGNQKSNTITFQINEGGNSNPQVKIAIAEILQQQWLRFPNNVEILVHAKSARKRSPSPKRRAKIENKCPYLESLQKGHAIESENYNQIKQARVGDSDFTSYVRITLEPDSPTQSKHPINAPDYEDINATNISQFDAR